MFERMAEAEHVEPKAGLSTEGSPLCKLFHNRYQGSEWCSGCPVLISTGRGFCEDTPIWNSREKPEAAKRQALRDHATFLRSLKPET